MNVTVVVGNPKARSRTYEAAHLVAEKLTGQTADLSVDLVDLGAALLDWSDAQVADLVTAVKSSDLAVFASPTYKATYTGLLKLFLDRIAGGALTGVTAVPVMLGGHWHLRESLRRRSQRHRMTWTRYARIADRWLPTACIVHPYPSVRLAARTQGRSPVRQFRAPGSVRRAARKGGPYRDPGPGRVAGYRRAGGLIAEACRPGRGRMPGPESWRADRGGLPPGSGKNAGPGELAG